MMIRQDREGRPFQGTAEELRRHNAKLRQRARRAKASRWIELPVADGLNDALVTNMSRGGFTDPRELITLAMINLARAPDDVFNLIAAVPQHDLGDLPDRYAKALEEAADNV